MTVESRVDKQEQKQQSSGCLILAYPSFALSYPTCIQNYSCHVFMNAGYKKNNGILSKDLCKNRTRILSVK